MVNNMENDNRKGMLLQEIEKLAARYELSKNIPEDYFEPGNMEFLDKSYGSYQEESGEFIIRFEVKGTRYEGRTEQIEQVNIGDSVEMVREPDNEYNPNNFTITTMKNKNLGNVPATICNVLAPFYDEGLLEMKSFKVSYVEPISKRSRHAKQAVLFVEFIAVLHER